MKEFVVRGMGGLGDCIHQRALVRQYMERGRVWLQTPWPTVYHDLTGDRLEIQPLTTSLRTQAKNIARQASLFTRRRPVKATRSVGVSYSPDTVRAEGSVLKAMLVDSGADARLDDFRLPVAPAWRLKAQKWLDRWSPTKPLLIYRPLNERTEWSGCANRNPDYAAYAVLFELLRKDYFVVSVADFQPGKEWQVGRGGDADVECHKGELDFETLAALTEAAALVWSSPGFAIVLAQAVGTPSVCVFGGYEDGRSFSAGAKYAPHLAIEPIHPCPCFSHTHDCDKAIDLPAARKDLAAFLAANPPRPIPEAAILGGRPHSRPCVALAAASCNLEGLPTAYANPGELERIIALVRDHVAAARPPECNSLAMVEIGCNSGRTAAAILRNVSGIRRYIGVDVPTSYKFAKAVQAREAPAQPGHLALHDPRFRLLLARRGTLDLSPDDFPAMRGGVVFIDGDHGAEAVTHDHALALQLVGPGGLIIHHDDHDLGNVDVRAVLDDLSTDRNPIVHVLGTWLAFQRVA